MQSGEPKGAPAEGGEDPSTLGWSPVGSQE